MRKNFGPKSWLYPMPVLIIATYNEDKTADAMNAAWGAISQSNHISICVSAGHEKAGFHTTPSEFVDAPVIDELPMTLDCRLVSYDEATGRLVGEIVNVSAKEEVLSENGKIDPQKWQPITFDPVNSTYLVLGEKVGNAFKDGMTLK